MPEEILRVSPLGGVEEIGLNSTLFSYDGHMILVDAGLMFPEENMFGVDFVIPDFTFVIENRDRLMAVFLTHGHEDHVGGLPFLLKEVDVPVYGSRLTLGLVREKLKEHHLEHIELNPIKPRQKVTVGPFTVEPIRVTHSIVDGLAFCIETPVGNIVHTGDFKLDPTPVDGELLDFEKFSEYGRKGCLVLLSDSTNSETGGFTFSEKEVRRAIENIFHKSSGRIILSTFSSNIHRVQQVIDVAVRFNRKVILCGRSMVNNTRIAHELGYLDIPADTWLTLEALDELPDEQTVIITTGSQGEPMSVLSRIAIGEHKQIKIKKGDVVVISAKMIPGNERSIGRIINHLARKGADVIHEKVSEIHVSGHASKEELKLMLNLVRPRYFIPIHGEYRHLASHRKLALNQGIPEENIFLLDNGEVLALGSGWARKDEPIPAGRVYIDGKGIGDVEEMVLRDRKRLSRDGIVLVFFSVEKSTGLPVGEPEIITRGLTVEESSREVFDALRELVLTTVRELDREIAADETMLKEKVRSVVRKHLRTTLGRRPIVLPLLSEV